MAPRKNATTPAPVAQPAPVAVAPVTPAAAPAGVTSSRQFRILESSIERLEGSPEVRLTVETGKKKRGDPTVVPGKTPGGAAKKAFTRMVSTVTAAVKAAGGDTENLKLSYKFAIQEEGHKPHWYVCSRSPLAEPKTVTRTAKDGASTAITIRYNVVCKAWKDPNAPVKTPRAAASAAPVEEDEELTEEEVAPAPVVPATPAKRGKGKGKQ